MPDSIRMIVSPPAAVQGAVIEASSLHDLFTKKVQQFADRIAVSDARRSITYAELDRLSSEVAEGLHGSGVETGTVVGMCLERSVDLVVVLLGILKAGGAYLPIDPTYPPNRIDEILETSKVRVIVCSSTATQRIAGHNILPLGLDVVLAVRGESEILAGGTSPVDRNALAYVIYTSGSTGRPKGVMVEHGAVLRLFEQTRDWFSFDEADVWSMFHSASFDFSVWEIWGALLHGGRVAIVPYEVSRSPKSFHSWLVRNEVTILNQTPAAFRNLDAADAAAAEFPPLRLVIFGGEALPTGLLRDWIGRHGDNKPALVNMYGITETAVHVTYRRLLRDDLGVVIAPIGVPIPDLRLHILDAERQPVPKNECGELYVEGPGVARGYLNQPGLTEERFPWIRIGLRTVRVYRTGDLVMQAVNGDYIYLGRIDDQLKVRGFRIEPAEVESCLLRSVLVSAVHVAGHDYGEGDVRLVAYVVPTARYEDWSDNATRELINVVSHHLPDYMRPSSYMVLKELPMTPHGKIDKRGLPAPEADARSFRRGDDQLLSSEEKFVLNLWSDELGLKGIGLHDDFFDNGGTSLALVRSLSRVKSHYNVELNLGLLADGATVKGLAALIRSSVNYP